MDNKECINTEPRIQILDRCLFLCKPGTEHEWYKRSGCLKIVHAHTGLQVDTGVYQKTSPSENVGLITQNVQ